MLSKKTQTSSTNSQFPRKILTILFGLGIWYLVLGTFFSGCKEPDISALGVQPDSEKLKLIATDTVSLISYTVPDDSVRSDETSLNLLGIYNDPVFGIAEAGIFAQLRLSSENVYFGNLGDIIIDSVILSLEYAGQYGSASKYSFSVYELSEDMYKDSNYYSTKTFQYKPQPLASVNNVGLSFTDSIYVGGTLEPPQLRIHLNPALGVNFISASGSSYNTSDEFVKYFKGIYIKSTNAPLSDEGAILYFNLPSSYSKITIHYRNLQTVQKFDYVFNDQCARLTNFKLDHSATSIFLSDSVIGNDLIYIQSMSGAKTKILIPFLEKFIANGKIAVHKAEIILNAENYSDFPPHNNLFLTNIDSAGTAGFLIDQFEGDAHYDGTFNSGQYVFNITRHIQFLLTHYNEKNYNYGMYLMAGGKAVNAGRTIIKGNKNSSGAMKLKISYTPLQ